MKSKKLEYTFVKFVPGIELDDKSVMTVSKFYRPFPWLFMKRRTEEIDYYTCSNGINWFRAKDDRLECVAVCQKLRHLYHSKSKE